MTLKKQMICVAIYITVMFSGMVFCDKFIHDDFEKFRIESKLLEDKYDALRNSITPSSFKGENHHAHSHERKALSQSSI